MAPVRRVPAPQENWYTMLPPSGIASVEEQNYFKWGTDYQYMIYMMATESIQKPIKPTLNGSIAGSAF